MAAPADKNIKNLNGVWTMNKTLTGNTDAILTLQGINWFIRKAIGAMTVTLVTKQFVDEDGLEHINITQPGTAGIKGTEEQRNVNGEWKDHEDHIFGAVRGTTKWIKLSDLSDADEDEAFLKKDWDEATQQGDVLDSFVESVNNGWTARQIWGFATIDGVRRYTRRVVVKKGPKAQRERLVYDFKEELKA